MTKCAKIAQFAGRLRKVNMGKFTFSLLVSSLCCLKITLHSFLSRTDTPSFRGCRRCVVLGGRQRRRMLSGVFLNWYENGAHQVKARLMLSLSHIGNSLTNHDRNWQHPSTQNLWHHTVLLLYTHTLRMAWTTPNFMYDFCPPLYNQPFRCPRHAIMQSHHSSIGTPWCLDLEGGNFWLTYISEHVSC